MKDKLNTPFTENLNGDYQSSKNLSFEKRLMLILDDSAFLSINDPIIVHGIRLPHWNQDGKYVFITFRLGDSLPKEKQDELRYLISLWESMHPKPWDRSTENEYRKLLPNGIENLLDNGFGSCLLRNKTASEIVENTMKYDDGKKYDLVDYVIMPNHIHSLIKLNVDLKIEKLLQEWKSVSSHRLKKQFGNEWCGWMEKYHDRHIRNEEHFKNVIRYIYNNYRSGGTLKKPMT